MKSLSRRARSNMDKILITWMTVIITISLFVGMSCGSPASTPTAESTASPTPAPAFTPTSELAPERASTVGWLPDGIISPGEYAKTKAYGDYEIHWSADERFIYVGMKARTSGWVAVAVQPGRRMKNADMVFGFVKGEETTIYDLFSTGDYGPHHPDTQLGGTDNIVDFAGTEEENYTTIEFKRALDTGDKYDNRLSDGTNKIIWAYGPADELTPKHSKRGYGELDL